MKYLLLIILTVVVGSCTSTLHYKEHLIKDKFNSVVKTVNPITGGGGSGVIWEYIDDTVYVMSNAHICKHVNNKLVIITFEGYFYATSYKLDIKNDLCLLKGTVKKGANIQKVQIAPRDLQAGDYIFSLGFPKGEFSITDGYLNASDNKAQVQMVGLCIYPGASGSGVFDSRGRLVGIISHYRKSTPCISYMRSLPAIKKIIMGSIL